MRSPALPNALPAGHFLEKKIDMEISKSPLIIEHAELQAIHVKIWDPLVRIFHWTVVTGVALDYFVFTDGENLHQWIGYAVGIALAVRIVWGLILTGHANFRSFVRGPAQVLQYIKTALTASPPRYLGHNPAAAVMIVTLMISLATITLSGWMQTTDAYWGVGWVQELHRWAVNGLLGLVVIHATAVVFESIRHGENLIKSMVTGWKRVASTYSHHS